MALQEQHVAFRFTGGVETKMDSKAVPPVRLLGLENGVFHRASSIKKRNGYDLLSRTIDGSTSLITDARRLASRGDELLLFTNTRCYSKQSGADQWSDAGALVAPIGSDRPVVHTSTAQTTPDHATSGGVTAYAWEDSLGGVYWTVEDETSERVLRAPTQANSLGQRPRCVVVGEAIHIYYAVPTLSQVCVLVVNPSQPAAAVSEQIVIEDLDSANPAYDVCPTTRTGTPSVIAWKEHGAAYARVAYVTAGGVLGSPASGHPSAARFGSGFVGSSTPIGVAFAYGDGGDGDYIGVTYFDSGGGGGALWRGTGGTALTSIGTSPGLVALYSAATTITRCTITATSDRFWCVWEESAAESSQRYCVVRSALIAGSDYTALATVRSVGLAGKAFSAGAAADAFAVFVHDTTYFNTYVTLRLSDFAPAGRHLPGSACGPTRAHLPSAYVTSDVASFVVPYKTRLESANNDKFTESAIRKVGMDFDNEDSHQTAQLGGGLYLAGACPMHYDGYRWTEQGFHVGPELISTAVAGGGSLTVSSTYQYKAWYEWTDAYGEVHRGPESIGTSVSTGASTQCTLTLPTLRITQKPNVRICVARSLPGDTSRLWRVTSLDPTTAGAVNGYLANSTSADTVTLIDRMSDTDLQLQEQIYTVGGILSNDPAPLGSHVAAGRDRLFFTDAQDGSVVRFSQTRATGFGLEVPPELQIGVDPRGGDVTALAVMDDVVYVFKASAIFAFNGDGPYSTGASTSANLVSGFSSSQLITSDVGCTDPASVVLTPAGLMFKSAKGIYQIARSREVTYVGAPVEAYNSQTVRRATVMPDRTAVLFLTDSGSSLYYDYLFQQWSTFTNHEGYDAAVVENTYHYLRTNDTVFKETVGEYADGSARITMRLETAWLHLLEHLQGFQRFWKLLLLGTWVSPHQLGVSYRMSYDEAWSEPYYLDATGEAEGATGWITGDSANPIGEDPILGSSYGEGDYGDGVYGGSGPDVYQWLYGIHEDGQAIQFRFEDFEKAGLSGASFELTEMTVVGGVKKPDRRPFSGARST